MTETRANDAGPPSRSTEAQAAEAPQTAASVPPQSACLQPSGTLSASAVQVAGTSGAQPDKTKAHRSPSERHRSVATVLGLVVVGMLGMSYAAVPLYDLFCRVTGYGGTTQVANAAPGQILADHPMTVRFDANRNRALPVRFEAVQPHLKVKPGESSLAFYQATNTSDKPLVAQATFNVTPQKAGLFFNKIDCFCFEEQFLAPGQSVDMPVVFFIDPDIASDRDAKEIRTVTLSYTFFEVDDPSEAMQQRMLSYDAASTLPEGTASDGPRG